MSRNGAFGSFTYRTAWVTFRHASITVCPSIATVSSKPAKMWRPLGLHPCYPTPLRRRLPRQRIRTARASRRLRHPFTLRRPVPRLRRLTGRVPCPAGLVGRYPATSPVARRGRGGGHLAGGRGAGRRRTDHLACVAADRTARRRPRPLSP